MDDNPAVKLSGKVIPDCWSSIIKARSAKTVLTASSDAETMFET
jgi:hypothetical protein